MSPLLLRESRLVRILWAAPAGLFFVLFVTTWFVLLMQETGPNGGSWRWTTGRYHPLSPEVGRLLFAILGILFVLVFVGQLARIMRSASTKSLSIGDRGVVATYGRKKVTLPPAALGGVRISRLLIGTRIRLNRETPPFVLTLTDALRFAQAMEHLGIAYRSNSLPASDFPPLDVNETVVWEGRPGLYAFMRSWWLMMLVTLPAPLIFAILLWNIWTGPSSVVDQLMFTFLALGTIGFTAIGLATLILSRFPEWSRELAGSIAVTDRRIAWREPRTGAVYREVAAGDILSAALVETNGRHGWIGLSVRGAAGRVGEIDLFNLPRPEAALAAIDAIAPPPTTGTTL
jgi:hypothetical protein